MNKHIEIQLKKTNFWQVERFVDQLSNDLELDNTYYGNILIVISELFEHFTKERPDRIFNIDFEAGHDGLVFEVQVEDQAEKHDEIVFSEESLLLFQTLTDDFNMNMDELHLTLFFDTKSVFSLMAKDRAQALKNYLKGDAKKVSKHNDSFQGN